MWPPRADDSRDCFFSALAQPYALTAAGDIDAAVAWANESLRIAMAVGSSSAAAHSLQARGIAQHGNPPLAIADARRVLELASSVHPTHVVADGALGRLAWITAHGDDLAEALRHARAAVFSAWSAHYPGGLYGSLHAAAIVLARLGDTEVAERLLGCFRSSSYRISRTAERIVVEALGRPIRAEPDDGAAHPARRRPARARFHRPPPLQSGRCDAQRRPLAAPELTGPMAHVAEACRDPPFQRLLRRDSTPGLPSNPATPTLAHRKPVTPCAPGTAMALSRPERRWLIKPTSELRSAEIGSPVN